MLPPVMLPLPHDRRGRFPLILLILAEAPVTRASHSVGGWPQCLVAFPHVCPVAAQRVGGTAAAAAWFDFVALAHYDGGYAHGPKGPISGGQTLVMEPTLAEMLLAGAKLMLIGMGIVYLFLSLLVWIIRITARLLQRFNPEQEALPGPIRSGVPPEAGDADVVAVIAAALHRYRNS